MSTQSQLKLLKQIADNLDSAYYDRLSHVGRIPGYNKGVPQMQILDLTRADGVQWIKFVYDNPYRDRFEVTPKGWLVLNRFDKLGIHSNEDVVLKHTFVEVTPAGVLSCTILVNKDQVVIPITTEREFSADIEQYRWKLKYQIDEWITSNSVKQLFPKLKSPFI